jgi:signal transduction histidine kinase
MDMQRRDDPAVAVTAPPSGAVARRGPLHWLRAALLADVALAVVTALLAGGEVRPALADPQPWLLVAVALALVPLVGFHAASLRPGAAPLIAAACGLALVAVALLAPLASTVLSIAWTALHGACWIVLARRASGVAGSVFEARLRQASLGLALLGVAPLAPLLEGAIGDLLSLALVAATWMAWNGTTVPRASSRGTSAAMVAVDRALQHRERLDDAGASAGTTAADVSAIIDPSALLDVVRTRLGARSVTLVDQGRVLSSTAAPDRRWRLQAVAALADESPLRSVGDGSWLHVAQTGRGELLVEVGETAELLGEPELEAAAWIAQRLGVALDRADTRRRDRAALASLRAADRMRDDFLATLSHELRTPLTSIRGFSEVLLDNAETLGPAQLEDLLGRVVKNAAQLELMIAGLLDLTLVRGRSHPERIAVYDLADLCERAVARCGPMLRSNVVDLDVPSVQLRTDGGALLNILEALLDNAGKFTPPGTRVTVTGRIDDGVATLLVVDEGPGLPPDLRERVLDPFVRGGDVLTRETRGVGIGLAIAAELARQLEGELTVGHPLTGTELRLRVPARHSLDGEDGPVEEQLGAPARVRATAPGLIG